MSELERYCQIHNTRAVDLCAKYASGDCVVALLVPVQQHALERRHLGALAAHIDHTTLIDAMPPEVAQAVAYAYRVEHEPWEVSS